MAHVLIKENRVNDTTIRLATTQDTPQILPLIRSLASASGEDLPSEEAMSEIIRQQIESDFHEYVIAEARGHVFGCILICYYLSTWAGAPYAMFQDFIVQEPWRNQGVGSTILAYARNRARIKKCVRIDLIVHSSLSEAKQFFERWGFRRIERDLYRIRIGRSSNGS
jgi:N-acetylglutamate synthase-like GNAT family acetyltransferase